MERLSLLCLMYFYFCGMLCMITDEDFPSEKSVQKSTIKRMPVIKKHQSCTSNRFHHSKMRFLILDFCFHVSVSLKEEQSCFLSYERKSQLDEFRRFSAV